MNNEIWLPMKRFEGYYEISNLGNIRRAKSKRLRRISYANIYPSIVLSVKGKHKTIRIHRLVAETFLPPVKGKTHVNHKNGNKNDNRVENLEWVTQAENNLHAYRVLHRASSIKKGTIPCNRIVNNEDIPIMNELNKNGMNTDDIAKIYGVCGSTIRKHIRAYRTKK